MPMTHGSNGGPPDIPLTAKTKLECIRGIVERVDLSAPQKCVGVGIVLSAERDWKAEVKTDELQRFASVKDRETVFRATKALDDKAIVAKESKRGQSGKFTVLPPHVVSAIIEAYQDLKSSRVEADHNPESGRLKPDGTSSLVLTCDAVGFAPTSQAQPDGLNPTGLDQPDRSSRTRKGITSLTSLPLSEEESPLSPPKHVDWLDGQSGLLLKDGKLAVLNGVATQLQSDFPSIDLAVVCNLAAAEVIGLTERSIDGAIAIIRKHAQIASTAPKRGTRLAADWKLPQSWGLWAIEYFEITSEETCSEAAGFRDYWTAQSRNAAKKDWKATWQNWIRNSRRKYRRRKPEIDIAPDLLPVDDGGHQAAADAWAEARRINEGGADG